MDYVITATNPMCYIYIVPVKHIKILSKHFTCKINFISSYRIQLY